MPATREADEDVVALLRAAPGSGAPVAVVVAPGGVALAARRPPGTDRAGATVTWWYATDAAAVVLTRLERDVRPRWVWWAAEPVVAALRAAPYGLRVRAAWDVAAVHRLLAGGWQADPGQVWAFLGGLDPGTRPLAGQLDLLGSGDRSAVDDDEGSPDEPVRPDGHLRPDWVEGAWSRSTARAERWAALALEAAGRQLDVLRGRPRARTDASPSGDPVLAAHAESAAEVLAAELAHDGLPVDRGEAEALLGVLVGPRSADADASRRARADRDEQVLRHLPPGLDPSSTDLRNPAQVRALLARVGLDLPDTRSWRLQRHEGEHPVVDALLRWRKAERMATTYGYAWLDAHVAGDGRMRGRWTGSDGGAGRMTAQAGLHSFPAELRPSVVAEPGHLLVRADLGQVEPRVLAAVSGDRALAAATRDDDLYRPVADRLGCERPVAKVAVLAAMYGQTSGAAGDALEQMRRAYPVAMRFLRAGEEAGRTATPVRTYGGRLVRSRAVAAPGPCASADAHAAHRGAVSAQGRYVRNALVQGAAAEVFKAWAAAVRGRLLGTGTAIVLCLHDELLLHAPAADADDVRALLGTVLDETAARWFPPEPAVRFVADVAVLQRWSDAKP